MSNVKPGFLSKLADTYENEVTGEDVVAYFAAVAAHPAYVGRFSENLVQPGIRIPVTADSALFAEAVRLGREVVWLHTFGERFAATEEGRPAGPPRLPDGEAPRIPADRAIPSRPDEMPNTISSDAVQRRLRIGAGYIDNVAPGVWVYEVSGKQVLLQWFSYRRRDRDKPIIGDRRPPSPLGDIQPEGWLAEYTTELLNVLHVLGRLVALEPRLADLLDRICHGPTLLAEDLRAEGVFDVPADVAAKPSGKAKSGKQGVLID